MAITATGLTSGEDIIAGTTATTASITPTSDALVIAAVVQVRSDSTNPTACSMAGNGLTWDVVLHFVFTGSGSTRRSITVLRAMGTASAGTNVITAGGSASTASFRWIITEFAGTETGANGASAIGDTDSASATATSVTCSLTMARASSRPYIAAAAAAAAEAQTPASGYTELDEDGTTGMIAAAWHDTTADTAPSYSGASSVSRGAIALELLAPLQAPTVTVAAATATALDPTTTVVEVDTVGQMHVGIRSGIRVAVRQTISTP